MSSLKSEMIMEIGFLIINQRTNDDLIQVPYVHYNENIYDFIEAFYHSELVDQDYIRHLRQNNHTTFNISEIKNLSG